MFSKSYLRQSIETVTQSAPKRRRRNKPTPIIDPEDHKALIDYALKSLALQTRLGDDVYRIWEVLDCKFLQIQMVSYEMARIADDRRLHPMDVCNAWFRADLDMSRAVEELDMMKEAPSPPGAIQPDLE